MGMQIALEEAAKMVQEFHDKVLPGNSPQQFITTVDEELVALGRHIQGMTKAIEARCGETDARPRRCHLIGEEAGEFIEALGEGDEVKALDAFADLLYVVFGTAGTYGWPMSGAFKEVHDSNMTKEKQADDPGKARVRQKGPNFRMPDIAGVLSRFRESGSGAPDDASVSGSSQ